MTHRFNPSVSSQLLVPGRKGNIHLVLGFGAVLLVLVIVAANGLLRMSQINNELSLIVNVHNRKSELIASMRDAMRQRQLGIRDMLLLEDPFEKEAAWERHTLAASRFMSLRLQFLDMPMTVEEKVAFDDMTKGATDGAVLQRQVASEIIDSVERGMSLPKVEAALHAQDNAFNAMTKLSLIQQQAAHAAVKSTENNYRNTIRLTVSIVVAGLLVSFVIAWLVIRRDRRMVSALSTYQNQLESLVDERTHELVNANRELESYSYSIAHDLNAPLRAVTSYSQILEEEAKDKLNADERDCLQRITRAGRVMNRLIEDILRLSRITRAEFYREVVNLSELSKSLVTRMSAAYPDQNIQWQIADELLVKGDPQLLGMLLEQLLDNARKFTQKSEQPEVSIGKIRDNGRPIYFVADNGCGFDMRYSDRLFTAFQRLHAEGHADSTGIGLAMAQRIVQRHGGMLWAESKLGQGATFFFTLSNQVENA